MAVLAVLIGLYGIGFAFGGAEPFYEGRELPLGLEVSVVALSFVDWHQVWYHCILVAM